MKSNAVFSFPCYTEKRKLHVQHGRIQEIISRPLSPSFINLKRKWLLCRRFFFPAPNWMNLDFKILRVHCKHGNWLSSEFETEANSVVWTEGSYEIKAKKEGKTIMLFFFFFFFFIAEEWILNNYWYSVWKHHGDLNVHSTFLINRVILLYLAPFDKSSLKIVPIFDTPTRFNEISGRRQMSLDAKSNCFIVCFKMIYRLTIICSNTSL